VITRKPMKRPTKPMRQVSEKRQAKLDAAGVRLSSTFTPKPAAPRKAARIKPALPRAQRKTLVERSGGFCEIRMTGCSNIATDVSHRISVKAGGRHGAEADKHARLSNVLHSCRSDHEYLHANPAAAKAEFVGWALEEWQEPTEWPVLYRGELSWLTDDGRVVPYEEGAA
jgi:hypothetical protein